MADVVAVRQQLEELNQATVMYPDLDLAYNMQLEEALAASVLGKVSSKLEISHEEVSVRHSSYETAKLRSDVGSPFNNLTSALQFQREELLKFEQEICDQHHSIDDMREMRRNHYDMEFAESLLEMSDGEWEREGDFLETLFDNRNKNDWDGDQTCNLYTAMAREEPGFVAIAWSLKDQGGRVLMEQSKYLGVEVAEYVADYTALLGGLAVAVKAGVKKIHVCCNSLYVVRNFVAEWEAHTSEETKFLEQIKEQTKKLEHFSIEFVPVHKNVTTTSLAHEAIGKQVEMILKKEAQKLDASFEEQSSPCGEKNGPVECPICFDILLEADTFGVKGCSHRFCVSCLTQYVETCVKSKKVPVKCPQECSSLVGIDDCRDVISPELVKAYAKALTEASIPQSKRLYCPFRDCSCLMSKDELTSSSEPTTSTQPKAPVIVRTECMECHRLFCAECLVPWHADMSCDDFQRLPPDERDAGDIKLYSLASNKKWQRCSKCRSMVELHHGCYHITCRCGHEFCYICGAPWVRKRPTCRCKLWDEGNLVRRY